MARWDEGKTREEFIRAAENMGFEVQPYSGRAMYGEECPSITLDQYANVNDVIAELGIRGLRTDSMGLGTVVYCPTKS